ncbi:MAG: hypothetical protein J6Y78_15430 [Paludibacteraceae bacterium]|nr:hypothetical protein [Paludibacteraceae bacterium]
MSERKITGWFTMNGKHVPIFDGESKEDAVKRSVANNNEDIKNKQIAQAQAERDARNKAVSKVAQRMSEKLGKKPSSSNENDKNIKFDDYSDFIYQNSHLSREEAKKVATESWNKGLSKQEALAKVKEDLWKVDYKGPKTSVFEGDKLKDSVKSKIDAMSESDLAHNIEYNKRMIQRLKEKGDTDNEKQYQAILDYELGKQKGVTRKDVEELTAKKDALKGVKLNAKPISQSEIDAQKKQWGDNVKSTMGFTTSANVDLKNNSAFRETLMDLKNPNNMKGSIRIAESLSPEDRKQFVSDFKAYLKSKYPELDYSVSMADSKKDGGVWLKLKNNAIDKYGNKKSFDISKASGSAVRKNLEGALQSIVDKDGGKGEYWKHIGTLSGKLDYGFNKSDLLNLGNIFAKGNPKINDAMIELLTDCNFHSEARLLNEAMKSANPKESTAFKKFLELVKKEY